MDTLKHSFKHKLSTISAFTLVELLVVIGIISVLAVALLVSLNPTESQRRARDAARIKDANTLQTVVEAYLNDGGDAFCTAAEGCNSINLNTAPYTSSSAQACNDSWLENDTALPDTDIICNYAKTVPVDPSNGQSRQCFGFAASAVDPSPACIFRYRLKMTTDAAYEINFMIESEGNARKAGNDSGTTTGSTDFVQISSSPGDDLFTTYAAAGPTM